MNVQYFYECQTCGDEHESYQEAKACHRPQCIFRCGECGEYYGLNKDAAISCCKPKELNLVGGAEM